MKKHQLPTDFKKLPFFTAIDALLILMVCAVAIGCLWLLPKHSGDTVCIYVNQELRYRVPLQENQVITIEQGEQWNQVTIRDGKVYVSDCNCPDRTCVNSGSIEYTHQAIFCVPHHIQIRIEGDDNEIDGITQ